MNKGKVFSTLTAVTVGAIAACGLVVSPTVVFADQHAAGEKSCSAHKECHDGKDEHGKPCEEHHDKH
jgi:hypothetical protein